MINRKDVLNEYHFSKNLKLIAALMIDLVGMLSIPFPIFGDFVDGVWGPISGLLIYLLFRKRGRLAVFGALEEAIPIPFLDFFPTACLAWYVTYYKENKKTLSEFLNKKFGEDQLVQEFLDNHEAKI